MRAVLELAFAQQAAQLVDSELPTTRAFWRKKFFDASDDEAADPRPFVEVLAARAALQQGGGDAT